MGSSFISSYAIQPDGSLRPLPNVDFDSKPGVYAESSAMAPSGRMLWALGTDPLRAGGEVLRRFRIGAGGALTPDASTALYTGTSAAHGRTMTLVPAR